MSGYAGMRPGEFWAILHKAIDAGVVLEDAAIDDLIRDYPLTPEELAEAARKSDETTAAILAIRTS